MALGLITGLSLDRLYIEKKKKTKPTEQKNFFMLVDAAILM